MFRIGIVELAVTCVIVVLALIIPAIVARGYARLDKRLKDIERKLEKKE